MSKIYVVIGSTGDYSDHKEWPVCWRGTKAEAEAVVAALQRQADEYWAWERDHGWSEYDDREHQKETMLDPSFTCYSTGTTYHVWAVCEDPQEDRLLTMSDNP